MCQHPTAQAELRVLLSHAGGPRTHPQAVYTVLREAEYRSTAPIPYWNVPFLAAVVPRQQRCSEALLVVNATLDGLIDRCKKLVRRPAPSHPSSPPTPAPHAPKAAGVDSSQHALTES